MTDRTSRADAAEVTTAEMLGEVPPRTPHWVKVFGLLTVLVALAFVALLLGGGHHGPGRHFRSGASSDRTPTEGGSR